MVVFAVKAPAIHVTKIKIKPLEIIINQKKKVLPPDSLFDYSINLIYKFSSLEPEIENFH